MSTLMHFSFPQKVLFKHCDPAGIVFFPRFAEMLNDAVETMFAGLLTWPFEDMHPDHGVPTAALTFRFHKPCRHGDYLDLQITLEKLGRSSLGLTTRAIREGELCFEATQTLVCIGPDGRPVPWPDKVRAKIKETLEAS